MARHFASERMASSVVLGASATWTGARRKMSHLAPFITTVLVDAGNTGTFSIYLMGKPSPPGDVWPPAITEGIVLISRTGISAQKTAITVSDAISALSGTVVGFPLDEMWVTIVTASASSGTFHVYYSYQVEA